MANSVDLNQLTTGAGSQLIASALDELAGKPECPCDPSDALHQPHTAAG